MLIVDCVQMMTPVSDWTKDIAYSHL